MSQSIESTETPQILSEFEQLAAQVKGLANKELTKLQKMIADELCRRAEQASKVPKKAATKAKAAEAAESSAEPKVKGETPIHLRQNREWTAYVRDHSRANGWHAFTWNKDAATKVPMPASEEVDGQHVYQDLPETHNKFTDAHAMSLAAELREANDALWTNWESNIYQPTEAEIAKRASAGPAKPKAAKVNTRAEMTYAAYVASIEQKAAEEQAKKERVAEREQKKAAKASTPAPAEKKVSKKAAAKVAEKPAEKPEDKPEEAAKPAASKDAVVEEKSTVILPQRKKAVVVKQTEAERVRATWVAPAEGAACRYFYRDADGKDIECLRDHENGIMTKNMEWIGRLNDDGVTVDTTAEDPYTMVEAEADDQ